MPKAVQTEHQAEKTSKTELQYLEIEPHIGQNVGSHKLGVLLAGVRLKQIPPVLGSVLGPLMFENCQMIPAYKGLQMITNITLRYT